MQSHDSLEEESYMNYLNHYGIQIKNDEVEDLKILLNALYNETSNINIFNQYYVSYRIPQIGKEFDLLRIGKDTIINIEIKSTGTEDKIQKQLIRNKYYLSYFDNVIYNLSFVSDIQQFYFLNDKDELEKVDILFLEKLLREQELYSIDNIDDLFDPTYYLVSPFNSTDKFINNEYFLTNHQEYIKNNIVNALNNNNAANFLSVTGSAGTGKTLLIYDIAKTIIANKNKPLIIHCGYLNGGQHKLNSNHGWEIIPIKSSKNYDLSNYDVVIIDEAQRIYSSQLKNIIETIKTTNGNCIFSYDKSQTLANWEERRNIDGEINKLSSIVAYNLSDKIRTNKEIAVFIKALFDKSKNDALLITNNVQLNYFNTTNIAKDYIDSLSSKEWEVIRFTPSQFDKEYHKQYSEITNKSSHRIIGQEFDNVAVVIDKFFAYGSNGRLIYNSKSYYDPVKMLFQNITRTRKKLNLIIIDNDELLDRCVTILKN